MVWRGVIIEESLVNKKLLKLANIVNTRESFLEKEENKGVMHFHCVEVEDSKKDIFDGREKKKLEAARNYALSIGIIEEQLPSEHLIRNPYD